MKRKALAALLCALLILSLAGCGSAAESAAQDKGYYDTAAGGEAGYGYATDTEEEAPQAAPQPGGAEVPVDPKAVSDKIIYSGYAEIETTDFDRSVKAVSDLITGCGGFLESSSVTGSNYSSGRDYRSASYTIRIPAQAFQSVSSSLSGIGNVTYQNSNADNITSQYYDTASRLEAYQIEYERLTEMLKKAATVEDMLSIESRLSDVRYSIESLTTIIRSWDKLVSYSTLSISLTEVKTLSSAQGAGLSYWQEVGAALSSSLKGIGSFFKGLFMFLIAALPVLAILAVVAVAAVLIIRRAKARKAAKKALPPQNGDKE